MSKKKAFLIHLGVSLLIFSIILMLIIFFWFPSPYFDSEYRMKWITMIAFVDIVIGPGLTLIVYKADKPSVRFDMAVILLLQMSALSWGVWNAWSSHPLTNVFFDGQIYCLDRNEIKAAGVDMEMIPSNMTNEIMFILPYPKTIEMKKEYLYRKNQKLPMVFSLGHLYETATPGMTAELGEKQRDIMPVVNLNENNKQQWNAFKSQYKEINKEWRYFSFNCFGDAQVAVLDRENNKIDGILKMQLPPFWNLK